MFLFPFLDLILGFLSIKKSLKIAFSEAFYGKVLSQVHGGDNLTNDSIINIQIKTI